MKFGNREEDHKDLGQGKEQKSTFLENMSIRSKIWTLYLLSGLIPNIGAIYLSYAHFSMTIEVCVAGAASILGTLFCWHYARAMSNPVRELLDSVRKVGQGDLTVKSRLVNRDEIGRLASGFNEMVASNAQLLGAVKSSMAILGNMSQQYAETSRQIAATAQQLASGAEQIAQGSSDQANAAQNTSNLMGQKNQKIKEVAEAADQASVWVMQETKMVGNGLEAAREAQNKMNEISRSSKRSADVVRGLVTRSRGIGQTANVITGIADQTNLLALNAAIEAARAGEHGRGFAVVAEEVRKLAEESKKAADQIANLNDEIKTDTENAVRAIEENAAQSAAGVEVIYTKVLTTLQKIDQTVQEASKMAVNIHDSTKRQLEMANQVSGALSSVASASEEASATTEEFSASIEEINASVEENRAGSQKLAGIVKKISDLIAKYKVEPDKEIVVAPDVTPYLLRNETEEDIQKLVAKQVASYG